MTSPRSLLKAWGINANKRLGQHFLVDPNTSDLIVRRSGVGPEDTILEIGAGTGALTIPIARSVRQVIAVELDKRLAGLLKNELLAASIENVIVRQEDILRFDFETLARTRTHPVVVIGNLPYNISSQVLIKLIQQRKFVETAVLMFQKELAERIMAPPGNRIYGRLSVAVQYCATVTSLVTVRASSFYPRPKVDSRVLHIRFQESPTFPADDEYLLFRLIGAAFNQRRKTIKNALKGNILGLKPEDVSRLLKKAKIDPLRRPETLGVKEFVEISNMVHKV
jgi:16S rRNA (adenine1518-N6/adenine1519-N6)-dimethyltransferase